MATALSTFFSTIRGSIAGLTLSNNPRSGFNLSPKSPGSRKMTNTRTMFRTRFAHASSAWNSLSQGKRDSWQDFARAFPEYRNGREVFIATYCIVDSYEKIDPLGLDPLTVASGHPGYCPVLVPFDRSQFAGAFKLNFVFDNTTIPGSPQPDDTRLYCVYNVYGPFRSANSSLSHHSKSILQGAGSRFSGGLLPFLPVVPTSGGNYIVRMRFFRKYSGFCISNIYTLRCISG